MSKEGRTNTIKSFTVKFWKKAANLWSYLAVTFDVKIACCAGAVGATPSIFALFGGFFISEAENNKGSQIWENLTKIGRKKYLVKECDQIWENLGKNMVKE